MRETVMTRTARNVKASTPRGDVGALRRGRGLALSLAALLLAGTAAGCSANRIEGASASADASPSLGDRFTGLFRSTPAEPQYAGVATPRPVAEEVSPDDITCPNVDVRQGASTLTVPPPGSGNVALELKYQGTIGQLARECHVSGGNMRMKVGMQGRIILGPAGSPGVVDVPLRYAVVREGPQPRTVVSNFFRVSVTVPPDETNVAFTHIDESIAFPMPSASDLESYVVYVGFDPTGAKPAPAKRTPQRRVQNHAPAR